MCRGSSSQQLLIVQCRSSLKQWDSPFCSGNCCHEWNTYSAPWPDDPLRYPTAGPVSVIDSPWLMSAWCLTLLIQGHGRGHGNRQRLVRNGPSEVSAGRPPRLHRLIASFFFILPLVIISNNCLKEKLACWFRLRGSSLTWSKGRGGGRGRWRWGRVEELAVCFGTH